MGNTVKYQELKALARRAGARSGGGWWRSGKRVEKRAYLLTDKGKLLLKALE